MKNLITGIFTKISGSALSSAVGGRVFTDSAPNNSEFPYIVFSVVSSGPDDPFDGEIEDTLCQFSIFSISSSAVEISTIDGLLITLLKDQVLTVAGGTNIALRHRGLVTMVENATTDSGTFTIKHWANDFEIVVEAD